MPARTKSSFIEEYQQYSPIGLKNAKMLLQDDISNYEESAQEATTTEWKQYWQAMKKDVESELSVCNEIMRQRGVE